jgi:TPP-dependent pyruvate/acetoin dehydrogenase alpha subunit
MDPAEIERWASSNDPIDRYQATLTGQGWASARELEAIDRQIDAELDALIAEVEGSPLPDPEQARYDVTGDGPVAGPWYRLDPPNPAQA